MFNHVTTNRKQIVYLLGVLIAAVIIVAAGMLVFTDTDSRSVSAESSTDVTKVKAVKINDSTKHANQLYKAKVEDVNDTALVADLFDVMGLEDIIGEYTVQISQEGENMVLALDVTNPVQKANKKVFNANMRKCAQQMLVLMPQIDRVQWTYQMISANNSNSSNGEAVVAAVDKEKFEKSLGKSPEHFGKSTDTVKKLLEKQAGK